MRWTAFGAVVLALSAVGGPARGGEPADPAHVAQVLEREIQARRVVGRIPSVAIALVRGTDVVWQGAFGESNRATQTAATPQTVYLTCSIWKPVTATALLRVLAEKGVGLDEPVGPHLGDAPVAPSAPDDPPITFRHLLTHTSGLPGSVDVARVWEAALPTPLADLTKGLRATGPPGRTVVYSNGAFALAGRLVERLSGSSYAEYLAANVTGPLGMTSTAVEPTPAMVERMAMPYVRERGGPVPAPYLRVGEFPAGGVWSTVGDYARFVAMQLGDGALGDARVLRAEDVAAMHRRTGKAAEGPEGFGLAWIVRERDGRRVVLHNGGLPGWSTYVAADLDAKVGVVLFSNLMEAGGVLARVGDLALRLLRGEPHAEVDVAAARRDPVPPAWRDVEGTYVAPRGPIHVDVVEGFLTASVAGEPHVLVPREKDLFQVHGDVVPSGATMTFRRDEKGAVTGFVGPDGVVRPRARTRAATLMDLAAAPEGEFAGRWEGRIRVGREPLRFLWSIGRGPAGLTGTVDIPVQGLRSGPLEHVLHHGKTIHAELDVPGARAVFEGTLDGDRIRGVLRQAGAEIPLDAWREGTPPP